VKGSWKHELDYKYRKATKGGDISKIDKANEIILEAIRKLDELLKQP
jgi:hypothetical protein